MPIAQPLHEAAAVLGLSIDARQQHALQTYLEQLQRWNATYNLTAIRDPRQMLIQHVFDSLTIIAPLRRQWGAQQDNQQDNAAIRVLDVGSGAGLPGMVIAIMQPRWHILCVDAVEKKTVFIQQVTRLLGLKNVTVRHARVESLSFAKPIPASPSLIAPSSDTPSDLPYTFAVSRAFASLKDFARLTGPLLENDGVLLAMKAKVPDAEMLALERETDWRVTLVEPLIVPMLDAQRCLIWLKRKDKRDDHTLPPSKDAHAPR